MIMTTSRTLANAIEDEGTTYAAAVTDAMTRSRALANAAIEDRVHHRRASEQVHRDMRCLSAVGLVPRGSPLLVAWLRAVRALETYRVNLPVDRLLWRGRSSYKPSRPEGLSVRNWFRVTWAFPIHGPRGSLDGPPDVDLAWARLDAAVLAGAPEAVLEPLRRAHLAAQLGRDRRRLLP